MARLRRLLLAVLVLTLGLSVYTYLHRREETVLVVTAAAAIPAHTALTTDRLSLRPVNRAAAEAVLPRAYHSVAEAVGLVTRVDIAAGDVIRREPYLLAVAPAGGAGRASYAIPNGLRLAAVRLDTPAAVSRRLQPGDRVDVLFTSKDNATGGVYTRTVLQAVEVFAAEPAGRGGSLEHAGDDLDVLLLLTPEQAQVLALAKRTGGAVDLALLPPGDESRPLAPVSPLSFITPVPERGGAAQ